MSDKLSAALHGSGPCKKSCCWTPYKCARDWTCDHHKDDARAQAAADEWREAVARSEAQAKRLSDAEAKRAEGFAPWR